MEEKEEAVRLDSLGDDVLYIIASHASFGALISLKSVSDNFSHFARWALKDERWDEARQLCAMPDELHRLSRRDTDAVMDRLAGGFLAALRGDDICTVEVLLHLGHFQVGSPVFADRSTSALMAPPLFFAHSAPMVRLLLARSANCDARRGDRTTALMDACDAGEPSVVRALCEGGANVHLTDRRHRPALEYALACASRSHAASQATLRGLSWRRPPEPAPVPDGYACARVLREWVEVAGTRSRSSTG